jgi:hypothetical protein
MGAIGCGARCSAPMSDIPLETKTFPAWHVNEVQTGRENNPARPADHGLPYHASRTPYHPSRTPYHASRTPYHASRTARS